MFSRILGQKISEAAKRYPILSVMGPRQAGKTTLLKTVFPTYRYVNLEHPENRDFALRDPKGFFALYDQHVILDEIQNVPDLFSYIQVITDEQKQNGQFILSGSQNLLLNDYIAQSLAGRVAIFKLLPFSLEEFRQSGFSVDSLPELLLEGLYPPIYDRGYAPGDWYRDYIETYLERDVRQLKNISDLRLFRKFLMLCAVRNGQIVNLSALGSDCGVSHNTVKEWLSVLEASYIIALLKPFSPKVSTREMKAPKLYFLDCGLLAALLNIRDVDRLMTDAHKGSLFETLMVSEYMKYYFNRKLFFPGYFWRNRDGHEIDLILDEQPLRLIEFKSSSTISSDFFKHIRYYQDRSTDPSVAYVVYGGESRQDRTGVSVLSWREMADSFRSVL